jgi:hypothetical protein
MKTNPLIQANIKIGKISQRTFDKADMCARELWRKKKYHSKKYTTSDDELMGMISTPVQNFINNKTLRINLQTDKIDLLIRASQISRISAVKNVSTRKGIASLPSLLTNHYAKWIKTTYTNNDFFHESRDLVINLGKEFYKSRKNIGKNGGCHAALASRFLFFSNPEMPVFNYSAKLGTKLGLKGTTATKIPNYYKIIGKSYIDNWKYLKKFKMPLSNHISDEYWLKVKESGWWQRRVLDIALLLHYRIFTEKKFIRDSLNLRVKRYL